MGQSRSDGNNLETALSGIVGAEDVSTRRDELVGYSRDAFPEEGVLPDAVVRVDDKTEVQEVLRYANDHGLHVVPRAMGTSLTGSVVPVEGGIVMDVRPMDSILEFNPDDMYARVQPGVRWQDLADKAAEYDLQFPVDPGSSSVVTVCGMIATHASGMRAVKYGTTGDFTLDLEVVLADGTIFETGTTSIKNSAGYDLTSLFVGSEGTLGVITAATVRLTSRPEQSRTFLALFEDLETAGELFVELKQSNFDVSALELLDRHLLDMLQEAGFDVPMAEVLVLGELEGSRAFEETYDELVALAEDVGAEMRDFEDPSELWEARRSAYPSLVRRTTHPITGDIGVPISTLPEALERIREIKNEIDIPVSVLGHAGDGNLHPVILASEDELERGKEAHDRICEMAVDLGGTVTTEHGVGMEKNHLMEYQYGEAGVDVMRRIKHALDHSNVLNPGKITPNEEDIDV